jgi:predicted secreted hydrolase
MKRWLVLATLLLAACEPAPAPAPALRLSDVLGGDNTAGFLRADQPREFSFPSDHGPHPGYRNEWWYVTGNVETADGHHFGYQVTFFNAALTDRQATTGESAWHGNTMWMAHVAITDVAGDKHIAHERFSRANPGLAGAQLNPFRVWLDDWQLVSVDGNNEFPWRLSVADEDVSLDLQLQAVKPPVLQGEQGLSRKSEAPGNASYYYSVTRLQTGGSIRVGDASYTVTGSSWLDREWSTSALGADQRGWDWFSLQFNDGQELMYYQLLDANGHAGPASHGNWTSTAAAQTAIRPGDIVLQPLASWTGPDGVAYTTRWQLQYAGERWQIEALVDDQFMALSLPYWEGAVRISDAASGAELGHGFLEMVHQ